MKKILLAMVISSTILCEPVLAAPQSDQLPDDLKKTFPGNATARASRLCPEGQYQNNQLMMTPTTPHTQNATDIPNYLHSAPRPIGNSTGINKWFAQTYYTKHITERCCRVKKAWVIVRGSHTPVPPPPNPLIGNIITNEAFAEFQSGSIVSPIVTPIPGAPFPATPVSSWKWFPVNAANVMSDGMISFAIGDDTNVHRTALYTQSCCLDPIKKATPTNATTRSNQAQKLIELMKQDKGRSRSVAPAPRVVVPRTQ